MYILSLTILSFYSFGQILASNKKYVKLHTVKHCIWTEKIMQNHTMIYIYVCEHSSNTDIHISNKADINEGH